MTSSNGNIFCVTGHLYGEFTGPRWIPHTKASDAALLMFTLICARKKRLSKQSWGWWFETQSHPLCRHRDELHIWAHSLVTTPPEKALEHRKSTGTVLDMTFDMTSGDSFEYFTTPFSRTGNRKIVSIYLLKWFACDIDISSFYAVSFRDSKYDPDSTLPWFENV